MHRPIWSSTVELTSGVSHACAPRPTHLSFPLAAGIQSACRVAPTSLASLPAAQDLVRCPARTRGSPSGRVALPRAQPKGKRRGREIERLSQMGLASHPQLRRALSTS